MSDQGRRSLFDRVWPFSKARVETDATFSRDLFTLGIVIVTSDPDLGGSLSEELVVAGNDVEVCQTIRSLRHSVRRRLPDAVLVDWRMVADAVATIVRFLRGDPECAGVTVVALVPPEKTDQIETILELGCDDFLPLPTDAFQVSARIGLIALGRGSGGEGGRDPVTGLALHDTLSEGLRHALYRARTSRSHLFAVFAIGVDGFETVTTALGLTAGDLLLEAIARRIEKVLQSGDLLARCSGDEFALLVAKVDDVTGAMGVASRIQGEFEEPFDLNEDEMYVSVGIGVALWGPAYSDPEDLLRDATTALSRARQSGRNHVTVFNPAMREDVVAELILVNGLKAAVKREEFCPYFQPIVSVRDGRISGFEALVRWQHPERGLLEPAAFIDIAEQTDTIIQMDRLLMEAACRQLRAWQMRFREFQHLTVSANVSTREFLEPDFVPHIDLILRSTGLYGRSLKIEVTESVLMEYTDHAAEMLEQLRKLAIGISIDDFGTGYSSFNYLRRFEIDILKIDRSFVSRMTDDDDSAQIVALVATLAKNLGKVTVAEGVETVSEFNRLRDLGVDQVQGFYIARPMSAEAAEQLLERVHDADNHLEKIMKDRLNRI